MNGRNYLIVELITELYLDGNNNKNHGWLT